MNEEIINRIRNLYSQLYNWHKRKGKDQLAKNFSDHDYFKERMIGYLEIIESMPTPEQASLDSILFLANHQLRGQLEWSYVETTENNIPLNQIAKEIEAVIKFYQEEELESQTQKGLDDFSVNSTEPNFITIKVNPNLWRERYFEIAEQVYSEVKSDVQNLGGSVALSDSNLEYVKHQESMDNLKFRNAMALHFKVVNESFSLVELAKEGKITITDVTIK